LEVQQMTSRRLHSPVRADRDSFRRFVASLPGPANLLGLTHVTTGYIFREILDSGNISAIEKCKSLGEPVVYAFYGRAAFRNQGDMDPTDLAFLCPVVLLLDPRAVPSPKYAFAFDSGAFVNGYMNDYLDPYMPLFDFVLEPDVNTAAQLVEYFFGSSDEFLANVPKSDAQVAQSNFEMVSYQKMLVAGGRGSNRLDDRVSTPELVFSVPIDIGAAVKAVILPSVLSDDPEIKARIASTGAINDGYEWNGGCRPSEYHMLIRDRVKSINRDLGWLK
jgi:hypothetical protein